MDENRTNRHVRELCDFNFTRKSVEKQLITEFLLFTGKTITFGLHGKMVT